MRINHNIQALNAYRNLNKNQGVISKHMEKLSSGLRINHASDDAAGLAISEKMRTQIRGLQAAERNSMDGISLVQTAEGALDSVQAMLQRMRELAVQAANDTSTENDRAAIQDEINQLTSEINRVGNSIEFNSRKLLDGSISSTNISNTGRLKGGGDMIVGQYSTGTIVLDPNSTPPTEITISAADKGTDLNGYKVVFGVDTNIRGLTDEKTVTVGGGNLTVTPSAGDTSLAGYTFKFVDSDSVTDLDFSIDTGTKEISIRADWDSSGTPGYTPSDLSEISTKLNGFLSSNSLGTVSFSGNAAVADLDSIDVQLDAKSNVSAAVVGRTITITADWNDDGLGTGFTGFAPKSLADIENAIAIALNAEGIGNVRLALTGPGGPFDASIFANAGEITLMGGVNEVPAKAASQIVSINSRPKEGDILVIDGKKIGFWDSSQTTYSIEDEARTKMDVDDVIDVFDGRKYLESFEVANEIVGLDARRALRTPPEAPLYTNVSVKLSEAGSDLIITHNTPGKVGNDTRTDYYPTIDAGLNLQIGANSGQKLIVDIPNIRSQSLKITGITAGGEVLSADGLTKAYLTKNKTVNNGLDAEMVEYSIDVSNHEHAAAAITIFEDALNRVSAARSGLGAYQNRLEYTVSNLAQTGENLTAAESRIRDADMALEMTNFTKSNIISQAAQAMLSQANQLPQGILQLLK